VSLVIEAWNPTKSQLTSQSVHQLFFMPAIDGQHTDDTFSLSRPFTSDAFRTRASEGFFPKVAEKIFPGEAKSGEISFFPLETKKINFFFAKNVIGKCQISKSRAPPPSYPHLSDHPRYSLVKQSHTHRLCSTRSFTTVFLLFGTVCSMYSWLWLLSCKMWMLLSNFSLTIRSAQASSFIKTDRFDQR